MNLGVRRRQQPIFKPRSRWPQRIAIAVVVAAVVALVVIAVSSDDDRRAVSRDDDLVHVHGLAINPADGGVSFGYNAIAVPVAAGAFEPSFGLTLRPEMAALSMSGSSFLLAVNAVLLKRLRRPAQPSAKTSSQSAATASS